MPRTSVNVGAKCVVILWSLVGAALLSPNAARAQEQSKKFELTLTPYVWLPSISGDIGTGPVTTSVDVCFTEVLQEATCVIGVFGRVEGWWDRLGFYVDGGYTAIRVDGSTPIGTDVSVTSKLGIVDFGLLLEVADWQLGEKDSGSGLELDAYVGGRYMYVGVDVDLQILPDQSASESWVDPVVGGRVIWDLNRKWSIIASGDVGGFGVASDFTWEAMGYLAYKFPIGSKAEGALLVGYKAIGDDYETGSGLSRFEWDVVLHGPAVGLAFQF